MATEQLVVGGIIVDRSGSEPKVLAARRVGPPALTGMWEFPGGKIEAGETPQAALRRELNEELSVRVEVGRELRPVDGAAWPISSSLELKLYFCTIEGGVVTVGADHSEILWLGTSELTSVDWLPSDQQAIDVLRTRL